MMRSRAMIWAGYRTRGRGDICMQGFDEEI